mmetsp:Transcript_3688/g.6280  ORF Transcript_3688/g.6280 Transcript_3688/m.6280 type:complete len:345 (+) Transcript_3688:801-1835(+)
MFAAMHLIQGAGGRVITFGSNLACIGAGPLKSRDNAKAYNKEEERELFKHTPAHAFYEKLGGDGVKFNVCFDLYLASPLNFESLDLASLNRAVQMTGGDLVYYSKFDSEKHGYKFYYDLFRSVSKITASQVRIKARCSKGLSVTEYFGGFGLRELADFQLASLDSDKTFGFTLRNDKSLNESKAVHVQVAVLYVNVFGETRLRILNQSFQVIKPINQYFKQCAAETFCQYLLMQKLARIDRLGSMQVREEIISKVVDILASYRSQCAPNSIPSQLVIPESLKLMPIYVLSALKSNGLRLLSTMRQLDTKIAHIQSLLSSPFTKMALRLYPRIYQITSAYQLGST